jgi:hypothetical protein
LIGLGGLVWSAAASARPLDGSAVETPASAAADSKRGTSLSGRWQFNPQQSEDVRQKMQESTGGSPRGHEGERGGGGGRGSGGGHGGGHRQWGGGDSGADPAREQARQEMRSFFEPSQQLSITDTEGEVVIAEPDGALRILHPDGRKAKAEGGAGEVVARRDGDRLLVERTTATGTKLFETYAVSDGKLQITARMDSPRRGSVSVRRSYDLAGTN